MSCTSSNLQNSNSELYSVERYKSADSVNSYLSFNFYHFEKQKEAIPAVFHVNGIMFSPQNNLDNYVLNVSPSSFEIKADYIGKKWTNANVEVEKGDSVHVKIYLKDDPESLH